MAIRPLTDEPSNGSNATKIYRIIQEKGENGADCDYKEGKIIKKPCILRDCDIDEKCKHNYECRSRYCDPVTNKCDRLDKCDKNKLNNCLSEDECVKLNIKYKYIKCCSL